MNEIFSFDLFSYSVCFDSDLWSRNKEKLLKEFFSLFFFYIKRLCLRAEITGRDQRDGNTCARCTLDDVSPKKKKKISSTNNNNNNKEQQNCKWNMWAIAECVGKYEKA